MEKAKKEIKLTSDPMENIRIMVPMLDDNGREAVSNLMYGYFLGKESAGHEKKELQEV